MPVKVIGPALGAVTDAQARRQRLGRADRRRMVGRTGVAALACAAHAPRVTLSAMRLPTLRSLLPRSLFGRALTILLVPIVALQLVVGLVFFQRHYQRVTEQMTRNVAYELNYASEQVEAAGRRRGGGRTPRRARRCRSTCS